MNWKKIFKECPAAIEALKKWLPRNYPFFMTGEKENPKEYVENLNWEDLSEFFASHTGMMDLLDFFESKGIYFDVLFDGAYSYKIKCLGVSE